ncbi:MAG: MFS transporter [Candidatus Ryanbacteria bacterium]|nr:MFS transporter [Candidatus Ryanbacteria bacterium]
MNHSERNYRILLLANSLMSFAIGLFIPYWLIFIKNFGNSIESFGFAIGLMMLSQSATSYFVGGYSDKLGRKIFAIIAGFIFAGIAIAYTFITSLLQLYVLQILNGVTEAVQNTMITAMLGDFTDKASRGARVGRYQAITGVLTALTMMGGGFIVGQLGVKIIFYITAGLYVVATVIIFYINESGPTAHQA